MKERIIIVFVAAALGLAITTIAFFIYQQAKILPGREAKPQSLLKVSPTPLPDKTYLIIDEPVNESISNKRTVEVKGKTNPENTLIITSNQEDQVVIPTRQGTFSAAVTIDVGANKIIVRSITPKGEEKIVIRIVTYSTEDF